ncbi:penicillin acylase family protein [Polynucleobacter necessarius]|uniref:penicillin acylase family protein n=1 Tax=Polynucleobacter necessarius TaxID=576610 RepID=UPI0022B260D2|nr:penicillin acylase family protein [Polynucleobacter necessarius]
MGRTEKFAWSFTNRGPMFRIYISSKSIQKILACIVGPMVYFLFKVRQEIIDIKGEPSLTFLVKKTCHGPVISDSHAKAKRTIDTSRYALALR